MRTTAIVLAPAILTLVTSAPAADPPPPKPADVGAATTVEVRLVTIDALVLDREERTVAGLGKGDFALTVDGKPAEIETFDVDCPIGDAPDPRGLAPGQAREFAPGGGPARRLVLVVDYYHVHHEALGYVFATLDDLVERRLAGDEELMLVALANGVRVEQDFTRDREAVRRALRRMQYDVSLFAGNFRHLTEAPVFEGLEVLYQILSEIPGSKAIVLYSDGMWPAALESDESFSRLAALAGNARAAVYPVVTSGLDPPG